ncbi:hypothetical protein JHK85_007140 [Glycine max]|nr:hypothetical protein JHK87_006783 [Glycine soja]KAG5054630.1 hypothetical protein JHK85_007140 [Glycine max]KAG5071736.1 hypothetical protein JHK86_006947 [Glycine max]
MEQQKLNFSLNSKARNVMLYTFLEEEYTKVHNLRSAKQIWDTLVVTYEVTSQVTTLRVLKNLDSMSLEELIGTLKVHEQELQQYKEDSDEDELAFISQKIYKMWRNKNGFEWKDKDKRSIVFYECKKPGHFKSECPDLEPNQDKNKIFKTKENKGFMSMWEDLDDTSSNEDDEEANICLMADTTSEGSESDQEDEKFQELENKLKDLQKDLKELNELHNHQKDDIYDLWR